ncbi:MAG: sulfotransferase domain-containing protein, partial [Pirellulaceae bacterium]
AHQRRCGFSLIASQWTGGAIYLVRNPLDIVDSMSDHADLSHDATIELMNNRDQRLGGLHSPLVTQYVDTWSRHVASWLDHADFPVLLVRYEDIHQAPLREFTRMVAFLGWEVDTTALQRAIPLACFETLQGLEREQGFQETSRVARSGRFFRRGQIDAWRELLSEPQVARIMADHGSMMARLGYHSSTSAILAADPRRVL